MDIKFSGTGKCIVAYFDVEKFGRKVVGTIVRVDEFDYIAIVFIETYIFTTPKQESVTNFSHLDTAKQFIIDEWAKEAPM